MAPGLFTKTPQELREAFVRGRFAESQHFGEYGEHIEDLLKTEAIAEKPNRTQYRGPQPARMLGSQVVADIGLEPRVGRSPAAALVDERPVVDRPDALGDETCAFHQL